MGGAEREILRSDPFQGHQGLEWRHGRRVTNGTFFVRRTGAPWRDLEERVRPVHDRQQPLQPVEQERHLEIGHGAAS